MSSAIEKLLTTNVLEVHKEACKNFANQKNVCRDCVDSCDQNAVLIDSGTPMVIDTKCVDCGACVGGCFVNAIDHLRKPYAEISEQIKKFPKAHITCDQVEEFNQGIKVPCLLYLDVPLLSQYAVSSENVHIFIGQCNDCRKMDRDKIITHLNTLQQDLTQYGFSIEINKNTFLPKEKDGQMVNAVSRRDIFKSFSLTSIRELLLPSTKKEEASEEASEALTIEQRMSFKKRLLNEHMSVEKNESLLSSAYYPSIEITDQCNGCDVCERICPTKALRWENEGEISRLMFETTACVHCNKCVACPKRALTIFETTKTNTLVKRQLILMKVTKCKECGETFKAVNEEETMCYFCNANSTKDPLRFFIL